MARALAVAMLAIFLAGCGAAAVATSAPAPKNTAAVSAPSPTATYTPRATQSPRPSPARTIPVWQRDVCSAFANMKSASSRGDQQAFNSAFTSLAATRSVGDVELAVSESCPEQAALLPGYRETVTAINRSPAAIQPPAPLPMVQAPAPLNWVDLDFDEEAKITVVSGEFTFPVRSDPVCERLPNRLQPEKYEVARLYASGAEIVSASSGIPIFSIVAGVDGPVPAWTVKLTHNWLADEQPFSGSVTVKVHCKMWGQERG